MSYASLQDLRDEGVTGVEDSRLRALLREVTAEIDAITGWFFEPRERAIIIDGRGTRTLELPLPPIRLWEVEIGEELRDLDDFWVVGAPVQPGFDGARIISKRGVFPKGHQNVRLEGVFGYTEPSRAAAGQTPPAIKRACILMVLRRLEPLSESRGQWRVIEERTRDQAYKLSALSREDVVLTGDPEVDAILWRYRRPSPLGAV